MVSLFIDEMYERCLFIIIYLSGINIKKEIEKSAA